MACYQQGQQGVCADALSESDFGGWQRIGASGTSTVAEL
jgi:hypothetical protein